MDAAMLRRILFPLILLLALLPVPAAAEVVATFWSHDRDQNYEHAFIVLEGTVEATGQRVSTNYGFTARRVSPMVLLRSVEGQMETVSAGYIARATSRPHFRVVLSDAAYARLMAFIRRWEAAPQPSYNLNRRNCVHFVVEAAAVLGLTVNRQTRHNRQPRQALDELMRLNPTVERAAR
jgi:hypothetical protein